MLQNERQEIEEKIKEAIYKKPYLQNFAEKIELFSTRELYILLPFFSSWDLNAINTFILEKKQEYLELVANIKRKKNFEKLNLLKIEEKLKIKEEFENSEKELELFFN